MKPVISDEEQPALTDMHVYLLITFSCLWIVPGSLAEECQQTVLARRHTLNVPEGGSLSLSCVVQHCGREAWTGQWIWRRSSEDQFSIFEPSPRHHLSNVTVSANQTRLTFTLLSVNQSDEGYYGCKVTWDDRSKDQGHMTYVNISSAVPSERSVLLRVLVCAGASLCLPVILGLARCLSSEVKPQPLPRSLSTNHPQPRAPRRAPPPSAPQAPPRRPLPQKQRSKATPKSEPNKELVYAALSQDALGQQQATREPPQATVYSSLRFS